MQAGTAGYSRRRGGRRPTLGGTAPRGRRRWHRPARARRAGGLPRRRGPACGFLCRHGRAGQGDGVGGGEGEPGEDGVAHEREGPGGGQVGVVGRVDTRCARRCPWRGAVRRAGELSWGVTWLSPRSSATGPATHTDRDRTGTADASGQHGGVPRGGPRSGTRCHRCARRATAMRPTPASKPHTANMARLRIAWPLTAVLGSRSPV